MSLPERVDVLIEVPKGGFVKRELDEVGAKGRIDFISPVPCPFNYGCVPEVPGQDGDPLDVVVLGPRLKAGQRYDRQVVGVVRFWDAGKVDDKLVAGEGTLSEGQRRSLHRFFRVYALARGVLNMRKGLSGRTEFLGVITREEATAPWRNRR
ncbi:MAG: hypothetical protein GY913_31170 [Proteobacteria bacterium]|nr:hypothetical protein [Pseudomonadota bacterium]MCP4921380.1 hypothetical protein [Pseudomonadota bacterium]